MKNNDNTSLLALSCSLAVHLLVFYIVIFGLPFETKVLEEEQVITFDMLPTSAISNVPTKKVQQAEPEKVEDAKKILKTKADPVPETPAPVVKKEPTTTAAETTKPAIAEEPELPKENSPVKEEAIDIKKPEPIQKKEPKPEPKPEKQIPKESPKNQKKESKPTTKPDKKKKIINDKDLDSLLKTLEQSSDGNNNKSTKYAKKSEQSDVDKESKGSYDENLALSISEIALIKQQIEKHRNIPIGTANIEQVKITLYIALNKDGTVTQVQIKDKFCGAAAPDACMMVANSAMRAVWQASPLENLSAERYSIWKEFNLLFDSSELLR
ncbi:hypothetical protein Trichorick_01213 [Candidatus Trichorickettsia mobilis]|uniref:Uncharacterized protein n=1 Tax=Candidatus Trichorickettsia mobilis TaxID=1346319 RepID=A0ABZ0UUG8_9RICK|nr:energy transducer TonB [Candidatus Trichorickettsia mobilis]WPY01303.1 hypothetical protein Trichorick_01213 [Candidatus Trichorickettsia mobilis]